MPRAATLVSTKSSAAIHGGRADVAFTPKEGRIAVDVCAADGRHISGELAGGEHVQIAA